MTKHSFFLCDTINTLSRNVFNYCNYFGDTLSSGHPSSVIPRRKSITRIRDTKRCADSLCIDENWTNIDKNTTSLVLVWYRCENACKMFVDFCQTTTPCLIDQRKYKQTKKQTHCSIPFPRACGMWSNLTKIFNVWLKCLSLFYYSVRGLDFGYVYNILC